MRYILLALAMLGVLFYISNPQAFGGKRVFNTSKDGRVVGNRTGGANVDFTVIGDLGADLFDRFVGSTDESPQIEASSAQSGAPEPEAQLLDVANATPAAAPPPLAAESSILSAIQTPDLATYNGRLIAIDRAMNANPEDTTSLMLIATRGCLEADSPVLLANYFVGIVQLVAETSQFPMAEQTAHFKSKSLPLTSLLKAWLTALPENQQAQVTQELQNWAARPTELVACHMAWLSSPAQ